MPFGGRRTSAPHPRWFGSFTHAYDWDRVDWCWILDAMNDRVGRDHEEFLRHGAV
jgi:hypothetical protein